MVLVCILALSCMTLDLTSVTDKVRKVGTRWAMHTDGDAPAAWKLNGFILCLWNKVFYGIQMNKEVGL